LEDYNLGAGFLMCFVVKLILGKDMRMEELERLTLNPSPVLFDGRDFCPLLLQEKGRG